ncbi:hypothetical protein EAH81_03185 [Flavobacterium pectinovorum]|uniref:Uncharacterized protein n=1 Tax=Flavobacterium pectinovorum TaxID=29533 RepID=A0A502F6M6_9FLAO|nr:hypothetical protein EAH81_03185 [Flavobacterium pectinovorum]
MLNLLFNPLNFKIMELAVMNLEDLNLVELNVQEVSEVEGGFFLQWPGIGWYMDCGFSYGYYA